MVMIHVGKTGKALFAQAHELQRCNLLFFLIFYPIESYWRWFFYLHCVFSYIFSKLPSLGLSGSLGYQLTSLTAVTNLWGFLSYIFSLSQSYTFLCLDMWFNEFCRDMSYNYLAGNIPDQLPPNLQQLYALFFISFLVELFLPFTDFVMIYIWCSPVLRNLANNQFSGGIPYSISQLPSLKYL